jgi:TolB-like protein
LSGYLSVYHLYKAGDQRTRSPATLPGSENPLSIVVLPFSTLGANAQQTDFADGLTSKLTSDLSRITGSMVIASTTALTFKGKAATAQQIGKGRSSTSQAAKGLRTACASLPTGSSAAAW